MRPNFFVNTPDILHEYLQYGGPAAFKIRAALAASGSPCWGVYAGYELFEHVAVGPGSEEYLDSEKYQIRLRDWEAPRPRAARWRRTSRGSTRSAARTRRCSCCATSPSTAPTTRTSWSSASVQRRGDGPDDIVIVVVNLDPHGARETTVHLDMPALGFDWHDAFVVNDEITGRPGAGASTTTCASTPATSPPTS